MPASSATNEYRPRHDTLLSALHHLSRVTPDNDFLVEDIGQGLTYRQSYILASTIIPSRLLRLCPSLSSPRRRKVAVISANNALLPLTLWALWFMSFTVVPISVKSEQSLWAAMISTADPDAIIISSSLKGIAAKHLHLSAGLEITYLENIIPIQFARQASPSRVSDFIPSLRNWLLYVTKEQMASKLDEPPFIGGDTPVISLFTSSAIDATTIKSVTYTHSMLVHSASRMVEMLGGPSYSNRPIRHLGWLSLSHCFEFCISLLGIVLETGGSYVFFDREVSSPQAPLSTPLHIQLLQALRYHQPVDSLCVVPAIFSDIVKDLDAAGLDLLKAMRSLGVGGAPTSEAVFQWAAEQAIPYFDCSGATEAAGTICIRRATVQTMKDYGLQVAPGLEGFLEKESLDDDHGELIIRGTFIPSGYDNRTSDSFARDPITGTSIYRTGDLYEQNAKVAKLQWSSSYLKGASVPVPNPDRLQLSGLKYLGRMDDMVVLASGVKIDALPVERQLNDHPLILRSAIVTNLTRETPVVLLQPKVQSNTPFDSRKYEEVVRFVLDLNRSLTFDKRIRPENIVIVDELPVTTKFTLNRKKIKKIWYESGGSWPGSKVHENDTSGIYSRQLHEQLLLRAEVRRTVENLLSDIFDIPVEHLSGEPVHFSELPLTSLSSVQLARALEARFSIKISAAQLYSFKSLEDICDLIIGLTQMSAKEDTSQQDRYSSASDTVRVANPPAEPTEPSLVITGASCRYPGRIRSLDDLWEALLDPQKYSKKVNKSPPSSRWDKETLDWKDVPPIAWLDQENFDNLSSLRDFFNLSPSDIESMPPNACLALQLGYQAIEDAGIAPRSLSGQPWGVFTSVSNSGWRERRSAELSLDEYSSSLSGSSDDAVGARLSYFLNLTGPALEIKTACSSSAVAIHQACSSIRNGDCEAAIVISSTTHFHPSGPIFRSKAGIASKAGRCATFSEEADGFLPAEGAAALIIQKSVDSKCVPYASIKASHITQDGRSNGFFAPNPTAQTRLVHHTLTKALCSEQDVDLIETHGTGTQLGDAVEMQALDDVFRGKRTQPLLIGAVKAVLGHTEETAGLTSILKSILCLEHNAVPGQPNIGRPNSQIDFGSSKFSVPRRITSFPRIDRPRRVGISSFGLSGTLAHIIIEDFNDEQISQRSSAPHLFLLSAHDQNSFESLLKNYLEFAMSPSALEAEFKAICKTSQLGRDHLPLRRAWVIRDHHSWTTELLKELHEPRPRRRIKSRTIKLGLWFGLPSCETSIESINCPLLKQERAHVASGNWDERYDAFAQQLIIANVLKSIGCNITAIGGEGMGEWVAGVFAGVLPIRSVFQKANQNDLETYLVQGSCEKLKELLTEWIPSELALRGTCTDQLHVLEGTLEAAKEISEVGGVTISRNSSLASAEPPRKIIPRPSIPIISGHLGDVLDNDTAENHVYWAHAGTRYFETSRGIECLATQCDLIIHFGGSSLPVKSERYIHFEPGDFERTLGLLYERGCDIDWARFGAEGRRLHMPTYEW
ncbi:hypothetical protein ACEPAF_202 [Sanghuangporus sanghuang]